MQYTAIGILSLALLPAAAHGYTAINRLTVNPVPGGFEVTSQGGDGPRQIWCAAAEYARVVERNGNNDRLYILRGYGPSLTRPGYRAVIFTTRPSPDLANGPRPGTGGDYSVSMRKRGFNLGNAHAESFCADVFEERDEWIRN